MIWTIKLLVHLADISLLVFSIFGLKALNEYYVPWEAKSKDGDNVNVRDGPDKDYKATRLLKGTEIVAIVDEVYDWYVLSIDPLEMVRQSTMKAIPKDDSQRRTEIYQYMLQYPPWHLIAIGVLWFWPSTRHWLRRHAPKHISRFVETMCLRGEHN